MIQAFRKVGDVTGFTLHVGCHPTAYRRQQRPPPPNDDIPHLGIAVRHASYEVFDQWHRHQNGKASPAVIVPKFIECVGTSYWSVLDATDCICAYIAVKTKDVLQNISIRLWYRNTPPIPSLKSRAVNLTFWFSMLEFKKCT